MQSSWKFFLIFSQFFDIIFFDFSFFNFFCFFRNGFFFFRFYFFIFRSICLSSIFWICSGWSFLWITFLIVVTFVCFCSSSIIHLSAQSFFVFIWKLLIVSIFLDSGVLTGFFNLFTRECGFKIVSNFLDSVTYFSLIDFFIRFFFFNRFFFKLISLFDGFIFFCHFILFRYFLLRIRIIFHWSVNWIRLLTVWTFICGYFSTCIRGIVTFRTTFIGHWFCSGFIFIRLCIWRVFISRWLHSRSIIHFFSFIIYLISISFTSFYVKCFVHRFFILWIFHQVFFCHVCFKQFFNDINEAIFRH